MHVFESQGQQLSNPILVQDPALYAGLVLAVFFSLDEALFGVVAFLFFEMFSRHPPVTGCWLQHVHDEVVHLVEHHKVNG